MSFVLLTNLVHHCSHTASRPLVERSTMPAITTAPSVLIRAARGSDGPALDRLAALDSAELPTGGLLVAEADGRLVAAVAASTGEAIADPFLPTADVVALLELRAAGPRASRRRRGIADRLGLRVGGSPVRARTA
jgi:hypothetical protein